MSRSSNKSSSKAPASRSARIAGARRAVIQSSPAGLISSSRRAWVIMPRSPTSATRVKPKRSLSVLELGDLGGQGLGIGGVAVEHFERHRAAVGGAQQAIDLQLALLAVAVVAELGQ